MNLMFPLLWVHSQAAELMQEGCDVALGQAVGGAAAAEAEGQQKCSKWWPNGQGMGCGWKVCMCALRQGTWYWGWELTKQVLRREFGLGALCSTRISLN